MKIRQATPALNFLDAKPDLLGGLIFVVIQVREIHLSCSTAATIPDGQRKTLAIPAGQRLPRHGP